MGDELFLARGSRGSRAQLIAAPAPARVEPEGLACLDACEARYICLRDGSGNLQLQLKALLLETPLREGGPTIFWTLRDVYWACGYEQDKTKEPLSRWPSCLDDTPVASPFKI